MPDLGELAYPELYLIVLDVILKIGAYLHGKDSTYHAEALC